MNRNPKVLGLAVVALLAFSAMAAASAQAVTPEFHCTSTSANCIVTSSGGTHGTGSNDNVFTVSTGKVKCTGTATSDGAELEGTAPKTTTTVTLKAKYTGCLAFGVEAGVNMEGCHYLFHLVEGGTEPYPVTTDVICPEGKKITVAPVGVACTITVGGQTGLTGITLTNSKTTEPTHIAATIAVNGITYTETGAECAAPGTHATGKYTGTATLTGFEDNNEVEGTKVGLHVF